MTATTGYILIGLAFLVTLVPITVAVVTNTAWFRRRVMNHYRKDLPGMHTYKVSESDDLFGPPFFSREHFCKAYNAKHAADRYFSWYQRYYKAMSDHKAYAKKETTRHWGDLQIVDTVTGQTTYLG